METLHTADHAAEHHCAEPISSELVMMMFSGLFDMTPRRSHDLEGVPRLHKRPGKEPANQASFHVYNCCRQYVYSNCRHKLLIIFGVALKTQKRFRILADCACVYVNISCNICLQRAAMSKPQT